MQVACNPAYYDGMINRYCRGDDSTGLSGGWSEDANIIGAGNKSLIADVSSLTNNCTCKAKSISAGTGYNAFAIPAGTAVGSSYSKTCDASGYTGTVTFACNADNGYANSATGCIQGCSAITGYASGNQYANWATTAINTNNVAGSCSAGLVPSAGGRPSRNCQAGSVWGAITGSCQCPAMTPGTGYSGTVGQANVGGTQNINCASNYYDSDGNNQVTYTCQSNGTWVRSGGACETPCNVSNSANNNTAQGTVSGHNIFAINWGSDGNTPRGTSKTVYGVPSAAYAGRMRSVCRDGWKIGYAQRACQANGTWAAPTAYCEPYVSKNLGWSTSAPSARTSMTYYVPQGCYNVFVQLWAAGGGAYGTSGTGHSAQAGSMGHFGVWTQYGWPSNSQTRNSYLIYIGLGGPPDHPDDEDAGGGSSEFYYLDSARSVYFPPGRGENNGGGAGSGIFYDKTTTFGAPPFQITMPTYNSLANLPGAEPDGLILGGSTGEAGGGNGQSDANDASNGCCGGENGGYANPQWIGELNTNIGGQGPADGNCSTAGTTWETRIGSGGCSIKRSSGSYYSGGEGGAAIIRCNRDVN